MSTYESDIKQIPYSQEVIFSKLSDLTNFEKMKNQLPPEALKMEITCDCDSITFSGTPAGNLTLRIINREEFKTIKFEAENSPIPANFWIQLVSISETETKMKLTLKAELPAMVKMMIGNKINDGINKFADGLAMMRYDQI